MKLLHLGKDGIVATGRILVIAGAESAPIRRLVRWAEQRGWVIDLTCGRKRKAVIVLDTGHLVLASQSPEALGREWENTLEGG